MRSQWTLEDVERVVAFHGHVCGGLTQGMRVAEIALREIGPHAEDEEVVAIVETDSCAVDAIQVLVGCTFGKGNLIFHDYGKHAFTFGRRSDGKAIRIVGKPRATGIRAAEQEALSPRERALAVLEADEEELYDIEPLDGFTMPERAQVLPSVRCEACGEMAMSSRVRKLGDRSLCVPCYRAAKPASTMMEPIGIVHNDLQADVAPPMARSARSTITVYPQYTRGLLGIEGCELLQVLFALDRAPQDAAPLQQRRRGDPQEPLRGVFAVRSPRRPNPIGLTTVKLLHIEGNTLTVAGLDAWDGTPVLDIKPYEAGGADSAGTPEIYFG